MGPSGNKLLMKNEIDEKIKLMQQKRASSQFLNNSNNKVPQIKRHAIQELNQISEDEVATSHRNINEKDMSVKLSDSFKSEGQRTPRQIRKMFSCISPGDQGSVEDLSDSLKNRSELNVELKKNVQRNTEKAPLVPIRRLPKNDYENVQLIKPKPPVLPRSSGLKDLRHRLSNENKYERKSDPIRISAVTKEPNSANERKSLNEKHGVSKPEAHHMVCQNVPISEPLSPETNTLSTFKSNSKKEDTEIRSVNYENYKRTDRPHGGFYTTGRTRRHTMMGDKAFSIDEFETIVRDIELTIKTFKGLKYDTDYFKLDKKLAKCYVEIDDCKEYSSGDAMKKEILLRRLVTAGEDLKIRITNNELLLQDILKEQVSLIATHYGITR